jgi:hypothetical protein
MDLFDSVMLALAAILPSIFVFFPGPVVALARLIGVGIPFAILFGALFVVVFVYLHSLVLRINRQQQTIVTLVQDAGLLREALERVTPARAEAGGDEASAEHE